MAKKSKIAKNEQRKEIVARYAERRAELRRLLEERLARGRGLLEELRSELVEFGETAGLVVEETTDGAVGAALLIEELDEALLGPRAVVVDGRV